MSGVLRASSRDARHCIARCPGRPQRKQLPSKGAPKGALSGRAFGLRRVMGPGLRGGGIRDGRCEEEDGPERRDGLTRLERFCSLYAMSRGKEEGG